MYGKYFGGGTLPCHFYPDHYVVFYFICPDLKVSLGQGALGGEMRRFLFLVYKIDTVFHVIAGTILVFMVIITFVDILMRNLGYPIMGTIEIISFCGAVVIGFAIPYSSLKKSHVCVDILIERINPKSKRIMTIITRAAGALLFLFIGYNFIIFGMSLIRTGQVTPNFRVPFYPIAFGLSLSCFAESMTLVYDLISNILNGDNYE